MDNRKLTKDVFFLSKKDVDVTTEPRGGDDGKDNQGGQRFGEMINQLGLHHHRVAAGCKVKDNRPECL